MQNEFQNAYETSKLIFTGHILPKIPAGMFAVVIESQAHCQFTDAVLPFPHRSIHKLVGSRKIAEYLARKLEATFVSEDGYLDGVGVTVFPKAPMLKLPPRVWTDEDIPF